MLAGETWRVAIQQTQAVNLNALVNVFHIKHTGTISIDDADAVDEILTACDGAYAAIETHIKIGQDPGTIRIDQIAFDGDKLVTVRNVGTFTWSDTYVPAGSGDQMPSGVAALVKLYTEVSKMLGKKFIGALVEGSVAGNVLSSGCVSALVNFASVFLTPITIGALQELTWGIMSSVTGVWKDFISADLNNAVSYQRRRKPGVGA